MYINNKTYAESHKCENCKNNNICKWVSSMSTRTDMVNKLNKDTLQCPINIKITCDNFEKKPQKQDGWRPTNRDLY